MKMFQNILIFFWVFLFFPSPLWAGGMQDCALENFFIGTRTSNSVVIFYGERIERKNYWAGSCGKKTIQECPVFQIKHKIKVLEVYKGSPPSEVTFYTEGEVSQTPIETGSVRKVLTIVEGPDYDEVFFSSRYPTVRFHDDCGSLYDVFARTYLDSYFKEISYIDAIQRLKDLLIRQGWIKKEKKKSRAPNPFSKKPTPPPPLLPPVPELVSEVFEGLLPRIIRRKDREVFDNYYKNPVGELFSLWVSKFPEFEKEIVRGLKRPGINQDNRFLNISHLNGICFVYGQWGYQGLIILR